LANSDHTMKLQAIRSSIVFSVTAVSLFSAAATPALAADAEKGKARSAVCVACHGVEGISTNPQWPNLAGQKDQYLILALKAYRDGDRQNPIMSPLAQGLSDEDIENLAAYYSGL
jgi:cytochrome c553